MFDIALTAPGAKTTLLPDRARAVFEKETPNAIVELTFTFRGIAEGEYVFLPACAYDGNHYDCLKKAYPPSFAPHEVSVDMPTTITDIPRLAPDGSGEIAVTTGDVSVPCMGFFDRSTKRGVLVFTTQGTSHGNFGLTYRREGADIVLTVTAPHLRRDVMYRWPFLVPSDDVPATFLAGERVDIPYQVYDFACADIPAYFDRFFSLRSCMGMEDSLTQELPFTEAFRVLNRKWNTANWKEPAHAPGYYAVSPGPGWEWQPGWVGGGMTGFALMALGDAQNHNRALSTLRYLLSTQTKAGFFQGVASVTGEVRGDGFDVPGTDKWHLIRKSSDVLHYAFKHFAYLKACGEAVPPDIEAGIRKTADAFVTLWERYGQFGQFVDHDTGDIVAGGSTSGGIAPAGLVSAWRWFGDARYLNVAKAAAEQYWQRDAANGVTTGGPGEILQDPDSESAYGLLESFVELYEETRDAVWLTRARYMAAQCASWTVPYNYAFPATSEFARLGIHTTGTVFANTQNKHSAPGICTLSGSSLFKLFRFTHDVRYLTLCQQIARAISPCMSRPDRPIWSWDDPPQRLGDGVICERVNMSDWEGHACVGGVFNASCWCETSLLVTMAELPGVYADPLSGTVCAFDDMDASLDGNTLTIANHTPYDADVTVFWEDGRDLLLYWRDRFDTVHIPSGKTIQLEVK